MSETDRPIVNHPPTDTDKHPAKQPRGLGRGLANLLSSTITVQGEGGLRVRLLPMESIQIHQRQPRTKFETQSLEELARSIREHGVLQPILVSEVKDVGTYKIIAGERRFRASQMAGLKQIPAVVRDPVSPGVSYELALIENVQRADLTPIEEATAYHVLLEEYKISQEDLAKRVGKDRTTITNTLRLLKLHPEVIVALETQKITVGHAKVLCGVPVERQPKTVQVVLQKKLSVRGLEDYLKPVGSPEASKKHKSNQTVIHIDPQFHRACKAAEELLSMKIELIPTHKDKGKVIFHYHHLQALTELFDILNVK